MATIETTRQGDVAVITFSNPPVNALAHPVREGLLAAVRAANTDPAVKAIVVTGAGRAFSAGADITEFRHAPKLPGLGTVIEEIEGSRKPVVAAINGLALGGGLEVTLGCHYRIVARSVRQLGLPEVRIGILPGAGGTQRLPRVVGVENAMDMIVSGAPIDAERALALGLVEKVVDGDVVAAAVEYARALLIRGEGARPTGARPIDVAKVRSGLFEDRLKSLARHPSGPIAPANCVRCVEAATRLPIHEGLLRERELFKECAASPYAKALQYAFFAERKAADIPDVGPEVKPRPVESVGIVGAGTMGAGIAIAMLNAGIPVTIAETGQETLDRGVAHIRSTIEGMARKGRLSEAEAKARLARLTATLKLEDLARADLIIEAVFESMAVKKEVFGKLDAVARPGAVLATNTSTLDVDDIAAATRRPADVLGLHFFSPANIMRLLEIVCADRTAKDVLATAMALAKRIGKVGVLARVCFGFVGNRMLEAYLEEVRAMMLEGPTPRQIDSALEGWGLAMGPNAMMDLAGLDVGYRIRKERNLSQEQRRLTGFADRMVEMGRHGQKTGAGFYRYAAGDRKPIVDPEVEALIRDDAARLGIARRVVADEEIVERCLLRLINEGARILAEGVAQRASDIDTMYLTGYGFPGWRGGPMWQAEHIGLATVAGKIRAYEARYGKRWSMAPLIAERAAADGKWA